MVATFSEQYGPKTTLIFSSTDGEASWPQRISSVSLLFENTVQPENTYSLSSSCQVRSKKAKKRISMNINHQHRSSNVSFT